MDPQEADRPIGCKLPHCAESFQSVPERTRHLLQDHTRPCQVDVERLQVEFRCRECGKPFDSQAGRDRHEQRVHSDPRPCPVAGCKSVLKPNSLALHMRSIHRQARVLCSSCGVLHSPTAIYQHSKICGAPATLPKDFRCTVDGCEASFRTASEVTGHFHTVHCPRVTCPIDGCGARMKRASLSSHLKFIHDRVRSECVKCGKAVVPYNLPRHLATCKNPHGERPFACERPGCGARFRHRAERKVHENSVHAERIPCPRQDCGILLKPRSLPVHMRIAHDQSTRACVHCQRELRVGKLAYHEAVCGKSGIREFGCTEPGCNKNFRTEMERRTHERQVHAGPLPCPRQGCSALIKRNSLAYHLRVVHEDAGLANCAHCNETMPKRELEKHLDKCRFFQSLCFCREEGNPGENGCSGGCRP